MKTTWLRRWTWPTRIRRRGRRAEVVPIDTPEAADRRKRAHDAWRSRNAWNHGDPPGVGGLR